MLGGDGTLLVKDARVEDQSNSFVCKVRDSLTNKVTSSLPAKIKVTGKGNVVFLCIGTGIVLFFLK